MYQSDAPDCVSCVLEIDCWDSLHQIRNKLRIFESGSVEFFAGQYFQYQDDTVHLSESFNSVEEFKECYHLWSQIFIPPDSDIFLAHFSKLIADIG
ncbi:MAG: hypothetical protein ABSB74_09635 [Tepidisphaeraceae bacterium]